METKRPSPEQIPKQKIQKELSTETPPKVEKTKEKENLVDKLFDQIEGELGQFGVSSNTLLTSLRSHLKIGKNSKNKDIEYSNVENKKDERGNPVYGFTVTHATARWPKVERHVWLSFLPYMHNDKNALSPRWLIATKE